MDDLSVANLELLKEELTKIKLDWVDFCSLMVRALREGSDEVFLYLLDRFQRYPSSTEDHIKLYDLLDEDNYQEGSFETLFAIMEEFNPVVYAYCYNRLSLMPELEKRGYDLHTSCNIFNTILGQNLLRNLSK